MRLLSKSHPLVPSLYYVVATKKHWLLMGDHRRSAHYSTVLVQPSGPSDLCDLSDSRVIMLDQLDNNYQCKMPIVVSPCWTGTWWEKILADTMMILASSVYS
jgi:hypothetical protein